MSALLVAHDPEIFPNPLSFIPERWLEADGSIGSTANKLEHYFLVFGKGSCVGINLANAELNSVLSTVLRRLGARLLTCSREAFFVWSSLYSMLSCTRASKIVLRDLTGTAC